MQSARIGGRNPQFLVPALQIRLDVSPHPVWGYIARRPHYQRNEGGGFTPRLRPIPFRISHYQGAACGLIMTTVMVFELTDADAVDALEAFATRP